MLEIYVIELINLSVHSIKLIVCFENVNTLPHSGPIEMHKANMAYD